MSVGDEQGAVLKTILDLQTLAWQGENLPMTRYDAMSGRF